MQKFLETGDIARREGVVPATIRADIIAGYLQVSATTARGSRLFVESEYERYSLSRARARKDLHPNRIARGR